MKQALHVPRNERRPSTAATPSGWLLLLHSLPAQPSNGRVKTWRRLQDLGAVSLKNSGYVLPHTADTREDFEWLRAEIVAAGGDATVVEAARLPAADERELVVAFRQARQTEYGELAASIMTFHRTQRGARVTQRATVERALRGFAELRDRIAKRDFFRSPDRQRVERALAAVDALLQRPLPTIGGAHPKRTSYRNRTWVTRQRPGVDRMASAWLIRRWIDPNARFAFVADGHTPQDGAVTFDTYEGEFSHVGDLCTYEVLAQRFGINSKAAIVVGHLVHDLDLKENRYGRPEASTTERLVTGLRLVHRNDASLLDEGIKLFEVLYQSFKSDHALTTARPPRKSRQ